MTDNNLIEMMKILRSLPVEFSKSDYDHARPRRSTRIETLHENGYIVKIREDEFEKEVPNKGVLFSDGTVISRTEYNDLVGNAWRQFLEAHGNVMHYYWSCGTKTITAKRYIYSANFDKLTAEVNQRIAALTKALDALAAVL